MAEVEKREVSLAPRDWLSRWFDEWSLPRSLDLWRTQPFEAVAPMRVEEFQEGDTLVVKVEMPGLDPDKDVEIDVSDQTLRIQAQRRQETKVEEKGRFRSEFHYGSFARAIPLPAGASEQDVEAIYKDGILEVRIPVDQGKAEARKVPIQRG